MVFEDKTGKRWRRIKKSGVAMLVASGGGVVALVAVTVIYLPHWNLVQVPMLTRVPRDVAGVFGVIPQPASNASGPVAPSATKPSQPVPQKPHVLSAQTVSVRIISTPVSTPIVKPMATPKPTGAPVMPVSSPSPTTAPGNSSYGHSHH